MKAFSNGEDILNFFSMNNIDIVLSFKALSEMLKNDAFIYYYFLCASEKILKNNGLVVICDVTNPTEVKYNSVTQQEYIPIVLNENIAKYKKSNNNLNLVMPLCCLHNYNNCNKKKCFTKCEVETCVIKTERVVKKEISRKIDYRLFIKNGVFYDKLKHKLLKNISGDSCLLQCYETESRRLVCYCSNENQKYAVFFGNMCFQKSTYSLSFCKKVYESKKQQ